MAEPAVQRQGEHAPVSLSVVLPLYNEADNVVPLIGEIASAAQGIGISEIICVDDGSTDDTVSRVLGLDAPGLSLRLLRHRRNLGQSAALRTGVLAARTPWVVTMDGDGQNDPADIARLIETWRTERDPGRTLGMVAGIRAQRHDSLSKRLASRVANWVRRAALRDGAVDTGCALRLVRRDAFLAIPYFAHLHRFLPAMMQAAGYEVAFTKVSQRPRLHGVSKYGNAGRLIEGLIDLPGVIWLRRRYRYFPGCAEEDDMPEKESEMSNE